MPRITFISALSISVILIGGAMWFRFFPKSPPLAQIVSVSQVEPFLTKEISINDFLSTGDSPRTETATPLTQTEAVSRQLFSDFMALNSQGGATSANIQALADQYAAGIKNSSVSVQKVSPNQIVILPDSEENLALYGNAIAGIRNKYKNIVATEALTSDGNIADVNSPAFSSFMAKVGELYQAIASELLLMAAPVSLAANHTELINNYLESAEVMRSLGNTDKEPFRAYASLNIYVQHTERELALFSNIQRAMIASGIILNSSI